MFQDAALAGTALLRGKAQVTMASTSLCGVATAQVHGVPLPLRSWYYSPCWALKGKDIRHATDAYQQECTLLYTGSVISV